MSATSVILPSEDLTFIHDEILNSWKEIAGYVNRGVRTVQRWERDLAFPVRRPRGKARSAVIALRSDIDDWLRSRPLSGADISGADQERDLDTIEPLPCSSMLVRESRVLRARLVHSRSALYEAVIRLTRSIERSKAQFDSASSSFSASLSFSATACCLC